MANKLPVIKAHIRKTDITRLEEMFAVLKEHGWVIPEWLVILKRAQKTGGEVITYGAYLRKLNELRAEFDAPLVTASETAEYYNEWCQWKWNTREWNYYNLCNQLAIVRNGNIARGKRSL
jgi:hypothetical protein